VQHHQLNCSPASSNHLGAAVFNPQGNCFLLVWLPY
jgi:hypothetical protein